MKISIRPPFAMAPAGRARPARAAVLALMLASAAPAVLAQAAGAAPAATPSAAQPATPPLRPAFAVPMQAAQNLLKEGKGAEALEKVAQVAALADLQPYEIMVMERVRAAAYQRLGDFPKVLIALEAALSTGLVAPADETGLVEAVVVLASNQKDHPRVLRWSQRYADLKGPNDTIRLTRIQSQLAVMDEKGALEGLTQHMALAEKAGRAIPEVQLRLHWHLLNRLDEARAPAALERLATRFPRPEYWLELLRPALDTHARNDRISIELYRLRRVTGNLNDENPVEVLADIAMRLGYPGEARSVIEEGYAAGILGKGARATEHDRLRAQAAKLAETDRTDRLAAEAQAARGADANALVGLGWAAISALPARSAPAAAEPGLGLIEQGLAKGAVRRPAEARLHHGIAQLAAGRRDAALATLRDAAAQAAGDPLAEPLRLWALWASAAAPLPSMATAAAAAKP